MEEEDIPPDSKSAWVREHMNGAVVSEVVYRHGRYEANATVPTDSARAEEAHRQSFDHLEQGLVRADALARALRPHSCGVPACTDWEPFSN
jgi:hypothetical protein